MRLGKALAAFAAALIFVGSAFGQAANGEITGTVTDASGAALPGVRVTITQQGGVAAREVETGRSGTYAAPALPTGSYTVKADVANFKAQVRDGIVLQVGRQERVDFVLQIGARSDEVVVREGAPLLRTGNAEVSEVIDNQRIVDLPLDGRQFVDLTLLSDNVFKSPRGTRGSALAQTGTGVLVAGQRSGHNMYYLDGVSVTDQYFNHLVAAPPIDSIGEFNIQKSIYPAEYGGKASATISAVIRSGTNALHGSVYEFVRNNVFDARNFFDPKNTPPFRQNQFGAAAGGALRKDKTFFFLNFEGLHVRQAQTQTFSVPTVAVRGGDFSGLATIYDPLSSDSSGQRAPFPGDLIPANRLDTVANAFLRKIPLPNLSGQAQNLLATPSLRNDVSQGVMRLDHHLTNDDTMFAHYYAADFDTFQPFGSSQLNESLVPGFGYDLTTRTKSAAIGETHVFNAAMVSEFRFAYLRVEGGQQSENAATNFAQLAGIGGILPAPGQAGYPSVSFSGAYTTAGDPANLFTRRDNSFDAIENFSWVRNSHSFKFGAYIFRLQFDPSESPNARGTFTYTPRYTSSAVGLANGNAFADFLLGDPSSAQAGIGPGGSEYGRSLWTHFYAQDDWRVTRSLTINYGLRYEINGQVTDTQNRLSNIELNRFVIASDGAGQVNPLANGLLGLVPVPYVTSKQAGYNQSLLLPNYDHIAPRVGLAWAVSDKTVVRTGWGLFFNQAAYNIQTALTENLPFFFNKSVNTSATQPIPNLTTANILLSNANGTIGGSSVEYPYRAELADSWSFDVQHTFGSNWMLDAGYFGSHVSGADNSTYLNVPQPGPGAVDPRRPDPLLSGFKAIRWDGWSIYNSGTLRLQKTLSHGFLLNASYTWSKSMDDASDVGSTFSETNIPQNVYDVKSEKADSSFDHRHRAVVSYSWALPIWKGRPGLAGKVLDGWTLTGLGSAQSGAPFTVILPNDNANIGAGPAQRPNVVSDPNAGAPHTAQEWFNTSAFQMPSAFGFGNAGRNVVLADDEINMDAALHKDTPIGDKARLEFRAEIFNIFNHTNFADVPGRTAFTATFGKYTSAENPRQTQFALKLLF